MAVKYSGILKFTDEIKAEIDLAADGAVEKAVVIDEDGTETPIGGTSDFTTATLSITNNLASAVDFAVAHVAKKSHGSDTTFPVISVVPTITKTITVVLYKGSSACKVITPLEQGVEATATGSVESSKGIFNITGNGAITVAATE